MRRVTYFSWFWHKFDFLTDLWFSNFEKCWRTWWNCFSVIYHFIVEISVFSENFSFVISHYFHSFLWMRLFFLFENFSDIISKDFCCFNRNKENQKQNVWGKKSLDLTVNGSYSTETGRRRKAKKNITKIDLESYDKNSAHSIWRKKEKQFIFTFTRSEFSLCSDFFMCEKYRFVLGLWKRSQKQQKKKREIKYFPSFLVFLVAQIKLKG